MQPMGYAIFDAGFDGDGHLFDVVHGSERDPFGLPEWSILTGAAVATAREWIQAHPEAELELGAVFSDDIMVPSLPLPQMIDVITVP